jgi:hypothetical protein
VAENKQQADEFMQKPLDRQRNLDCVTK